MFFYQFAHVLRPHFVAFPFFLKVQEYSAFALGIDDVDLHRAVLQETEYAVDCLDEIVKFESDSAENRAGAVALKVTTRAGKHGFSGEVLQLTVRKVDDVLFPFVERLYVLVAVDRGETRTLVETILNCSSFGFQIMP